jgi:hypothetical protein
MHQYKNKEMHHEATLSVYTPYTPVQDEKIF